MNKQELWEDCFKRVLCALISRERCMDSGEDIPRAASLAEDMVFTIMKHRDANNKEAQGHE